MLGTILIVDDDATISSILAEVFRKEGFSVFTAGDGRAGLNLAYSMRPDLIIMDIVMPRMNGLEAIKELRGSDWGKNIVVVVLTNFSSTSNISKALEGRISDFIDKSQVELSEIVSRIKNLLSSKT